jgi:predicted RNA binding protein YcfA (HicA-like mRNA interferase family)
VPKRFSSKEIIKTLQKQGFSFISQKGSHVKFNKNGKVVIVVVNLKEVPIGTFNAILKQSGLKQSDFLD